MSGNANFSVCRRRGYKRTKQDTYSKGSITQKPQVQFYIQRPLLNQHRQQDPLLVPICKNRSESRARCTNLPDLWSGEVSEGEPLKPQTLNP